MNMYKFRTFCLCCKQMPCTKCSHYFLSLFTVRAFLRLYHPKLASSLSNIRIKNSSTRISVFFLSYEYMHPYLAARLFYYSLLHNFILKMGPIRLVSIWYHYSTDIDEKIFWPIPFHYPFHNSENTVSFKQFYIPAPLPK